MADEDVLVRWVDVYRDDSDEWRWRAIARNGEVVADSAEGYANRDHAVEMAVAMFASAELRFDEEA
jgi:uncharacterized protein YegP (UPF0339 family)